MCLVYIKYHMPCDFQFHFLIKYSQQPMDEIYSHSHILWKRVEVTQLPSCVSQFWTFPMMPPYYVPGQLLPTHHSTSGIFSPGGAIDGPADEPLV